MKVNRLTRREVLYVSGVAVAGLAGCQTQESEEPPIASEDSGRNTPTITERPPSHTVDAPETQTIRNSKGKPAVRSSAHSPQQDHTFSGEKESSASWDFESWRISSPDERDALKFSRTTTGISAAQEFIGDTDLAKETLVIFQYKVNECMSTEVDQLQWGKRKKYGSWVNIDFIDFKKEDDCNYNPTNNTKSSSSKESEAIIVRLPIKNIVEFGYGM